MEYPPPPPVPSDVDPATLAAYPLEELAGAQQAELMAAIKALGDGGDFPEARVQELTQAHERAALPERDMLLKYTIPQLNIIGWLCASHSALCSVRCSQIRPSSPSALPGGPPPQSSSAVAVAASPFSILSVWFFLKR